MIKEEDKQNRLLLDLSRQILDLTAAIHQATVQAANFDASRQDRP